MSHSQPEHRVSRMIRKNHVTQQPYELHGEPYEIRKNRMMRRCLLNPLMHVSHQQNRRMCKKREFPVNHMMRRNRRNHWLVRTELSRMNRKIRVNAYQLLQSQSERQHPAPEEQNYRTPSSLPTSRLLNCSDNVLLPSTPQAERHATQLERLGEMSPAVKQRGLGRMCRLFPFPIVGCTHSLHTPDKKDGPVSCFLAAPPGAPSSSLGQRYSGPRRATPDPEVPTATEPNCECLMDSHCPRQSS